MLVRNKDDIEFVTEFPCFLGHPVQETQNLSTWQQINKRMFKVLPSRPSLAATCQGYFSNGKLPKYVIFSSSNFLSLSKSQCSAPIAAPQRALPNLGELAAR